jgi:hypothetical protein
MDLKFDFPDKNSKGYLRRQHKIQEIVASGEGDPEIFSKMVDLLLEYVVEPSDRDEARELLWDMSEVEYNDAMAALQERASVPKNK